jgi:hypothetical protein
MKPLKAEAVQSIGPMLAGKGFGLGEGGDFHHKY